MENPSDPQTPTTEINKSKPESQATQAIQIKPVAKQPNNCNDLFQEEFTDASEKMIGMFKTSLKIPVKTIAQNFEEYNNKISKKSDICIENQKLIPMKIQNEKNTNVTAIDPQKNDNNNQITTQEKIANISADIEKRDVEGKNIDNNQNNKDAYLIPRSNTLNITTNTNSFLKKKLEPRNQIQELKKRGTIFFDDIDNENEIQIFNEKIFFKKRKNKRNDILEFKKEPIIIDLSLLLNENNKVLENYIKRQTFLRPEHHGLRLLHYICKFISADKKNNPDFFENSFSYYNSFIKEYWFCFSCYLIVKKERFLTGSKKIWHHDECKKIDLYLFFSGDIYYTLTQAISKCEEQSVQEFLKQTKSIVYIDCKKLLYQKFKKIMTKIVFEEKRYYKMIEDLQRRQVISFRRNKKKIIGLRMSPLLMDIDKHIVFSMMT